MQIGEYDVEERIQRPDIDQNFLDPDPDIFDEEPAVPCLLCNEPDHEEVMLLCDGCDGPFHTYCCGLDEVPQGVWYCPLCLNLESEPSDGASGRRGRSRAGGSSHRSSRNSETRRARPRQRTQRNAPVASRIRREDSHGGGWARVWQDVWSHLNSDLDRVNDDQEAEEAHLREWTRRAEIAQAQGDGHSGFRAAAPTLVYQRSRPRELIPVDSPASPEAIAAWSAFDEVKRRESRNEQSTSRKRKSTKSSTPSPKNTQDSEQIERKLKRPRTKPSSNFINPQSRDYSMVAAGPSTPSLVTDQRTSVFGSWLSKLDGSSAEKNDHGSPPAGFPTSRVTSASPTRNSPPMRASLPNMSPSSPPWSRPHSPQAATSPASYTFSPSVSRTPRSTSHNQPATFNRPISPESSASTSPTRPRLSFETKEEIRNMVQAVLRPHYQARKVSTEQYTEISKSVSRHLYEVVGSPSNGFSQAFNEVQEERERLRILAEQEVIGAIRTIS